MRPALPKAFWGLLTLTGSLPLILRVRIIDELLKRDKALRAGKSELAAPSYQITVGNMYGSSVQQGTDRSPVVIDYRAKQDELRKVLEQIEASVEELRLSAAASAQLQADTGTIEAQMSSPHPKPSIIMESLHSVKTILENAAGSVAASALLPHIINLLGG